MRDSCIFIVKKSAGNSNHSYHRYNTDYYLFPNHCVELKTELKIELKYVLRC